MSLLKKITFVMFTLALCSQGAMFGMKSPTGRSIAQINADLAKARVELLEAELAAAQGKPVITFDDEQQEEVAEDAAATDLAKNMPPELADPLMQFAQEFKNSAAALTNLQAQMEALRQGRGPGRMHGGPGRMHGGPGRLALPALLTELNKPENAKVLPEQLKFQLIQWAWRLVRLQEEGKLGADFGTLVAKARAMMDKEPMGRGHHRFGGFRHGHGGPGRADSRGPRGPKGPGRHEGGREGRREGGRHGGRGK